MKDIRSIHRSDTEYPGALEAGLGERAPETIYSLGDVGILKHKMLGFFCSVKCPGSLIIKTYDLARELRDAGVPVISGFHSPVEKEALRILLRGKGKIRFVSRMCAEKEGVGS